MTYTDYDTFFGSPTTDPITQKKINYFLNLYQNKFETIAGVVFGTQTAVVKEYQIYGQYVYIQSWQSISNVALNGTSTTDFKVVTDKNGIIRAIFFCKPFGNCDKITITGTFGYGIIPELFTHFLFFECEQYLKSETIPTFAQTVTSVRSLNRTKSFSDNQIVANRRAKTVTQELPSNILTFIRSYIFNIPNYKLQNYEHNHCNCD